MAWSPAGTLYITENAFDVRGSRPVWGTGDVLWKIEEGKWYGWPDYVEGQPVWKHHFKVPGKGKPDAVLATYPNQALRPAAIMGVHSSSNGIEFSRSASFGYEGEAFVAQFGDMAPEVGKVLSPVGYKIVKINIDTGVIDDFAVNKGKKNGPASWLKKGGLERPMDVAFDPAGTAMYVADFGIMQVSKKGSKPVEGTGVVWKITRQNK
jgi:glucose/arabinose dehydrogenase